MPTDHHSQNSRGLSTRIREELKTTFRLFEIDRHSKFITNGRLEKLQNGNDLNYWAKEDYDLVLVDEAHRYRNHTSQAFGMLQRICKLQVTAKALVSGTKESNSYIRNTIKQPSTGFVLSITFYSRMQGGYITGYKSFLFLWSNHSGVSRNKSRRRFS
ncbi:MAG: hypothetical protein IPJ03_13675 [Ignavibacteriales bacterium]|nr:hypothetical protein [Ignavibacteriales bacterium]